jgi:hypothetical protein
MVDRIIAGTVNADGTIKYGQDFAVTRTTVGHYVVQFRPAFAQVSGGSVTQVFPGDGDTRDNAVIISLSATDVYLKTGGGDGRQSDRNFTFVMAGTGSVTAQ